MEKSENSKSREEIILEMRDYAEEQFDKLIVYLNSGALVLTIGFVKDIIKITKETNITLLILSWCSFVLSLLFILLSHKSALASTNNEIKGKDKLSDCYDMVTTILNWLAFIILIIGLVLFVIFISKNL